MSFKKKQLLPDERLVFLSHQHALVLTKPLLVSLICVLVIAWASRSFDNYWPLLIGLAPAVYLFAEIMKWRKREYIVTNYRIVRQEGVLSINSFDAPLDKINNVFHEQSLFGRLFGFGKVGLETASEQGTTTFDFLPDPLSFKNCIVKEREAYRSLSSYPSMNSTGSVPHLIEELASLRDRNLISTAEFEEKKKALLARM
jgi:uncharacterized membrane protein YdbT with pleckstrin-like domain